MLCVCLLLIRAGNGCSPTAEIILVLSSPPLKRRIPLFSPRTFSQIETTNTIQVGGTGMYVPAYLDMTIRHDAYIHLCRSTTCIFSFGMVCELI